MKNKNTSKSIITAIISYIVLLSTLIFLCFVLLLIIISPFIIIELIFGEGTGGLCLYLAGMIMCILMLKDIVCRIKEIKRGAKDEEK